MSDKENKPRSRVRPASGTRSDVIPAPLAFIGLAVLVLFGYVIIKQISSGAPLFPVSPDSPNIPTIILPPTPTSKIPKERMEKNPVIGPDDAPVKIVEYGDFNCAACITWHRSGVLKSILDQYGDKVQFIWEDFPITTPVSYVIAEAAQCAFDQGKFWEYHDYIYDQRPDLSNEGLIASAAALGLDSQKFRDCLTNEDYLEVTNQSTRAGFALGFQGAPSFTINDQKIEGPITLEQVQAVADPLLAGK